MRVVLRVRIRLHHRARKRCTDRCLRGIASPRRRPGCRGYSCGSRRLCPQPDRRLAVALAWPRERRHAHGDRRRRQRGLGHGRAACRQAALAADRGYEPGADRPMHRFSLSQRCAHTGAEALDILRPRRAGKAERIDYLMRDGYPAYTHLAGMARLFGREARAACQTSRCGRTFGPSRSRWGSTSKTTCAAAGSPARRSARDIAMAADANQRWDVAVRHRLDRGARALRYGLGRRAHQPRRHSGHIRHSRAPWRPCRSRPASTRRTVSFSSNSFRRKRSISIQIDATRVGGVNENLAILLLAGKFGVRVFPHAGGVGLCELVQHLAMADFVADYGQDGRSGDRVCRPSARALHRSGTHPRWSLYCAHRQRASLRKCGASEALRSLPFSRGRPTLQSPRSRPPLTRSRTPLTALHMAVSRQVLKLGPGLIDARNSYSRLFPHGRFRRPVSCSRAREGPGRLEFLAGARGRCRSTLFPAHLKRSVSELFRMIQVLEFQATWRSPPRRRVRAEQQVIRVGHDQGADARSARRGTARNAPARRAHRAIVPPGCRVRRPNGHRCSSRGPGDLGFSVRIGYRRSLVDSTSGLVLYAFQSDLVRRSGRRGYRPRVKPPRLGQLRTTRPCRTKCGLRELRQPCRAAG